MNKSNFDELLERYLANKVTEEERTRLEMWLDVMKHEDTRDMELSAQDEERLYQKIIAVRDASDEIKTLNPYKRDSGKWTLRIASAIAFLAFASAAWWYAMQPDTQKLILEDGTLVWLNEDSRFSFANQPGERLATLSGEALFEVAKDPSRPFTIRHQNVSIRVVGTSFRLRTGDSLQLTVLTGKVYVSSSLDSIGVEVIPNEKIIYIPDGLVQRTSLPQHERNTVIAHTEYAMDFENTVLADVAHRLTAKFDVDISVEDRAQGCRLTIDLTDHSLVQSLEMIGEVLHVQYRIEGNKVFITGSGCKP